MVVGSAQHGRQGRTIGLAAAFQGLSALGGPALGGLAVPAIGEGWAFAVPAVLGSLVVAGLALEPADAVARRMSPRIAAQLADVLRNPDARSAALCFLAIGVVGGCVQTLAPLQLGSRGVGAQGLGLLFIVAALAAFPIVTASGRFTDAVGVVIATRAWVAVVLGAVLLLAATPGRIMTAMLFGLFLTQIRVGGTIGYVRGTFAGSGRGLAAGFGVIVTAWRWGPPSARSRRALSRTPPATAPPTWRLPPRSSPSRRLRCVHGAINARVDRTCDRRTRMP